MTLGYQHHHIFLRTLFCHMSVETLCQVGLGRLRDGLIVSNKISTDSPLMVADLIVQSSSLPEFSVHCCTVLSPSAEAVAQHKPSGMIDSVNKTSYSPSTLSPGRG